MADKWIEELVSKWPGPFHEFEFLEMIEVEAKSLCESTGLRVSHMNLYGHLTVLEIGFRESLRQDNAGKILAGSYDGFSIVTDVNFGNGRVRPENSAELESLAAKVVSQAKQKLEEPLYAVKARKIAENVHGG